MKTDLDRRERFMRCRARQWTSTQLKDLRTDLALSPSELAAIVGASPSGIYRWEATKGYLSIDPAHLRVLDLLRCALELDGRTTVAAAIRVANAHGGPLVVLHVLLTFAGYAAPHALRRPGARARTVPAAPTVTGSVKKWPDDRSPCGRFTLQKDGARGEMRFHVLWIAERNDADARAAAWRLGVKNFRIKRDEGWPGTISGTFRSNIDWATGSRTAAIHAAEQLLSFMPPLSSSTSPAAGAKPAIAKPARRTR